MDNYVAQDFPICIYHYVSFWGVKWLHTSKLWFAHSFFISMSIYQNKGFPLTQFLQLLFSLSQWHSFVYTINNCKIKQDIHINTVLRIYCPKYTHFADHIIYHRSSTTIYFCRFVIFTIFFIDPHPYKQNDLLPRLAGLSALLPPGLQVGHTHAADFSSSSYSPSSRRSYPSSSTLHTWSHAHAPPASHTWRRHQKTSAWWFQAGKNCVYLDLPSSIDIWNISEWSFRMESINFSIPSILPDQTYICMCNIWRYLSIWNLPTVSDVKCFKKCERVDRVYVFHRLCSPF